jgi:hypothetical protein
VGLAEVPKYASFEMVPSWSCNPDGVCGYSVPCDGTSEQTVYTLIAL